MRTTILLVILVISEAAKWQFTVARYLRARRQAAGQPQPAPAAFSDPDVAAAYEAASTGVAPIQHQSGEPKIPVGL